MYLPRNTTIHQQYQLVANEVDRILDEPSPVVMSNTLSEKQLEEYLEGKLRVSEEEKSEGDGVVLKTKPKTATGFIKTPQSFGSTKPSFSTTKAPSTALETKTSLSTVLNHHKESVDKLLLLIKEKNPLKRQSLLPSLESYRRTTTEKLNPAVNVLDSRKLKYPKDAIHKPEALKTDLLNNLLTEFYKQLLSDEMAYWKSEIDQEVGRENLRQLEKYYDFLGQYTENKLKKLGIGENSESASKGLTKFNFMQPSNKDTQDQVPNAQASTDQTSTSENSPDQLTLLLKEIDDLRTQLSEDRKTRSQVKELFNPSNLA